MNRFEYLPPVFFCFTNYRSQFETVLFLSLACCTEAAQILDDFNRVIKKHSVPGLLASLIGRYITLKCRKTQNARE